MPLTQTEKNQRWRVKNREAVNANQRKYKKANRAMYTAAQGRRRAGIGTATPDWSDSAETTLIYKQAQSLEKLLGRKMHVDHAIPLNHPLVCGLHVPDNLTITFAEQNMAKSNNYKVA